MVLVFAGKRLAVKSARRPARARLHRQAAFGRVDLVLIVRAAVFVFAGKQLWGRVARAAVIVRSSSSSLASSLVDAGVSIGAVVVSKIHRCRDGLRGGERGVVVVSEAHVSAMKASKGLTRCPRTVDLRWQAACGRAGLHAADVDFVSFIRAYLSSNSTPCLASVPVVTPLSLRS